MNPFIIWAVNVAKQNRNVITCERHIAVLKQTFSGAFYVLPDCPQQFFRRADMATN